MRIAKEFGGSRDAANYRLSSATAIHLRYAARRVTRKVSGPKKGKTLGRKAKLKSSDAIAVDTQQLWIARSFAGNRCGPS